MRELWPHQQRGLDQIIRAIDFRDEPTCVTSPTGGGKSELMVRTILWAQERKMPTVLYTNRKMLLEQTQAVLDGHEIEYGTRASGHKPALLRDVQISSMMTEKSRSYGVGKQWDLHDAKVVLLDEAHVQKGDVAEQVIADHVAAGATVLGFTATPLGIGHLYKNLIVAGTNSELRECGALVPCMTYGPDEPDTRHIKRTKTGEYTENDVRKVIMTPTIFARVFEWWKKLNPDARPAILFAPGVAESIWFAEQFEKQGIRAAHIDGDDIYLDKEFYKSSKEGRADILEGSRDGSIKVICNRFVLREGIDAPWLYHGIMATVFGALTSFLQSGGRLLRAHQSLDHVILQDHGGSWHRHGSLNADREWSLEYTNHIASGLREERLRSKAEPEPIVCPKCSALRLSGPVCLKCGFESKKKSRMVVQVDGSLKEMTGDIFKPRRTALYPNTDEKWQRCFHQSKNSKNGMTYMQALGWFFHEHHYYPPRTLPNMPINELDWFRPVRSVPKEDLVKRTNLTPQLTPE